MSLMMLIHDEKMPERPKFFGLYSLALYHLTELEEESRIIPFRLIFERWGTIFHLTKPECWELIFLFRDLGFIEMVGGGHGIMILKRKI